MKLKIVISEASVGSEVVNSEVALKSSRWSHLNCLLLLLLESGNVRQLFFCLASSQEALPGL